MELFLFLHHVAARRSDGLHPELARLFAQRAAFSASSITELHRRALHCGEQAGPNPSRTSNQRLPDDVLRFPCKRKSTVREP